MTLDVSQLTPEADAQLVFIDDVAYLRRNAIPFIHYVIKEEKLECTHVEPLVHGTWNSVYLLQPQQIVLKLSPWSNNYEIDFFMHSANQDLAIPELITHGKLVDNNLPDAGYLLMHYIPNTANPDQLLKNNNLAFNKLNSIGQNVASILATLHKKQFGYIRSSDTKHDSWAAAINLKELTERDPFDAIWLKRLEDVFEITNYRTFTEGHLIHSDANLNNVLIDKDSHVFKALIDPGPTIIGMPMFDLAYATWPWQYGLEYMDTMIETYQSNSTLFDESLFYASLMFIAYQQAEYGNFRAEHMPFFEKHIASKF